MTRAAHWLGEARVFIAQHVEERFIAAILDWMH
jgi:hypothetical protein